MLLKVLRKFAYLLLIHLGVSPLFGAESERLCARFELRNAGDINLSDVEREMICGNPESAAWKSIPDNQAEFHLRSFLQTRGYFEPKLIRRDGHIVIDPGVQSKATGLQTQGEPADLDVARLRGFLGHTLTPGLLDDVKNLVKQLLASRGFACAEVEMRADYRTGELQALLKSGTELNVTVIREDPFEGLNETVLRRYDAFLIGHPYNADLLQVTVQRTITDGIVQSTYFTAECTKSGVLIRQSVIPGPPRTMSVGFGANTERGPVVRASWKNSRVGRNGSSLSVSVASTLKQQELASELAWYYLTPPSRHYLLPSLTFRHDNITPRESVGGKFQLAPAWSTDSQTLGFQVRGGPTLNFEHTLRGTGPNSLAFLTVNLEAQLTDHYFELFRGEPRMGFDLRFQASAAQRGVASDFSARMVRLNFQKLWNYRNYLPPSIVFGLRGGVWTTFTDESVNANELPSTYRYFLGGSTDVRGFAREELPGPMGALTAVYLSGEVRFNELLHPKLQPFLFIDCGMLGSRTGTLNSPLYWSPGLGMRWNSPIGVLRTTLARGYREGSRGDFPAAAIPHWQFYLSLGEEF